MYKRLQLWWKGLCRSCESFPRETGLDGYCHPCYQYEMWKRRIK